MSDTCRLEITSDQYRDIQQCEAVIIREYETASGGRIARPVAWGDEDEMREDVDCPAYYIIPVGFKILCQTVVMVCDLPKPETTTHERND